MRTADELQGLQAGLDGIGHVLRDLRLKVPVYQRSYAWEGAQVQTFWEDLRAAVGASQPSYFMGTIVLAGSPQDRERTIIDGQQRLATASILLAVIRDTFKAASDLDRSRVIENDYLTQRTLQSVSRQPRLHLNTQDARFFNAVVLGLADDTPPTPHFASNQRIADAYEQLAASVEAEVTAARDSWRELLMRWVEFLEAGVQVIVVRVLDETDAFLVFETLNDRGLALTVADLLKNYLFGQAREDVSAVEEPWLAAVATLETPDGSQRFLDFLRQFWSSYHGATRERDLYQSMRRHVRSSGQAIEVSRRLQSSSRHYLALVSGDVDYWPSALIDVATVETLNRLRLSQNRPLLLAAIEELEEETWTELVRSAICWGVRGLTAGGIGGGTTERAYSEAAVAIREGDAASVREVAELLSEVITSDEAFRQSIRGATVPRNYLARYYWMALEESRAGSDQPAFIPVKAESDVSLFRVLPRSPNADDWPAFEVGEVAAYANRLGNAFILERDLLGRADARDWDAIRAAVRGSEFTSTRSMADLEEWSPETISEREAELAAMAPSIWPRLLNE